MTNNNISANQTSQEVDSYFDPNRVENRNKNRATIVLVAGAVAVGAMFAGNNRVAIIGGVFAGLNALAATAEELISRNFHNEPQSPKE